MKVFQFIVSLLIIINFIELSRADDGLDTVAMKRPFCNAFTGCGRKRDPAYATSNDGVQIPSAIYRALLRLAASKDSAAEVRMRQRFIPNSLENQEQLPIPRVALF